MIAEKENMQTLLTPKYLTKKEKKSHRIEAEGRQNPWSFLPLLRRTISYGPSIFDRHDIFFSQNVSSTTLLLIFLGQR